MRRALLFLFVCVCIGAVRAGETPGRAVASKISSVTVYSDRALVKRIFSADLPAGFISVSIPDLPSKMLNESVRVTGKGTSGATISGVRVAEKYLEESTQEAVNKLQDQKDQLESRIKALDDRKSVLASKKAFVESISRVTSESVAQNITVQRPSLDEWAGMVNFVDKTLNEIGTESRSIDAELKDLNNKKSITERELSGRQYSSGESQKSVVVDLDLDDPGSITMELSYIVMGANWTPIYDIRASSETDTISVIFMANVRQNTGEDWDDVQLELSTARPYMGDVPRVLDPWYLNIADPTSFRARGGRSGEGSYMLDGKNKVLSSGEEISSDQSAMMKQVTETQIAIAQVSQQLISTSFSLKQSETIPSNNAPKKVSVKIASAEGKKEYYAVPKSNNYAYLRTKITNHTNFPLLPGNTSVFFDGNFVSASSIPLVVPSESFDLFLGIDEGIKIKRELVEKFSDPSGVLNKKDRIEYKYKITIENYRDKARKITILDQIPVTQDDRIDVKALEISPKPQYQGDDELRGILRWVFDLGPRGKEEISFNYQIKYPSGMILVGLE